ncbi:MAG: GNAT family N-acetyltransferase [Pseudomonadota bacterium]
MPQLVQARPNDPEVAALIDAHFLLMRAQSPPESCHVFSADALAGPAIRLYALRDKSTVVAIGAIRVFGTQGELKSMHTESRLRGQGYGRVLLNALIAQARDLNLTQLLLETGSGAEHAPARNLYASEGFAECPPFGDYVHDRLSLFMARDL